MPPTLISSDYLAMNAALHERPEYGLGAWHWIGPILHYARLYEAKTLLDYGAGKMTFAKWFPEIGVKVFNYDPVTAPKLPRRADFVICLDVLEHIEPEMLDAVLDDLKAKMAVAGVFVISNREAKKILPDGRNAHLIIEPPDWWADKLRTRFAQVVELSDEHPELKRAGEVVFLLEVGL